MNFFELIAKRQSGRSYINTPVEREKIQKIMEAGAIAPSACNSQPWRFIAVDDTDMVVKLAKLTQKENLPINMFANNCPAFIVICEAEAILLSGKADQKFAQIDLGIATAHMSLAATELGLDNCIMGSFQDKAVMELCGIPNELKVRLILAVGYPVDQTIRPKKRKALHDIIKYNQW